MTTKALYRCILSTLLLAVATAAPAIAQDPPPAAPALPQAKPSADATVVIIFGRRKPLFSDQSTFRVDTEHGSPCTYVTSGNEMQDGSGGRSRTNAPFGNASQEGPPVEAKSMGLNRPEIAVEALGPSIAQHRIQSTICLPDDYLSEAARADIARWDTTMKDAAAAYRAGDYAKALPLFKAAFAKVGYAQAADMVGQMYLLGQGTPRDTAQAIVWLKKAIEGSNLVAPMQVFDPADPEIMTGRTEAAMTLGKIYAIGWDVPADPKAARHWFHKADDLGYIPAAHVLGRLDETHYGNEGTLASALAHLLKAGQAGYAPAQYELGVIYYTGGDGVPQDKDRAGAWLVEAAKNGNADALYACGRMYDLGEGGAKIDPKRALVYYKEAAAKGQPDAQNAIGLSFYLGQGLPKDDKLARMWFERAAEGGSAEAMFNLAVMEANGEGGQQNLVEAYAWMRLAQRTGLDKAGPAAEELATKLTPEQKAQADKLLNPKDGK
jgi:TPR repeat protein